MSAKLDTLMCQQLGCRPIGTTSNVSSAYKAREPNATKETCLEIHQDKTSFRLVPASRAEEQATNGGNANGSPCMKLAT